MAQIIRALMSFIMEIGRSGDQYRTRRSKNSAGVILVIVLALFGGYATYKGVGIAYVAKIDVVRIKREMEKVEAKNKELFDENVRLQIRNEILSNTLTAYIGRDLVNKLQASGKTIARDKLPVLEAEHDPTPIKPTP